MTRLETFAGLK